MQYPPISFLLYRKNQKKTCLSWLLESKKQSLAALFREHEHLERWPE
jgi:hypothetical protein